MSKTRLLSLLLFVPFLCTATDLKPWFGTDYEAEIRATVLYQNYDSFATPDRHTLKRTANDEFVTLSVAYPFHRYCGEFEATAAHTRKQRPGWDCFRLTGRYQWWSEADGCPLSIVFGLTGIEPFSRALHDISSFHHGHIEGEATIAVGKKYGETYGCTADYLFRWWTVVGSGIADKGSPWVRGDAACEVNLDNVQQIRALVNTLWGTGNKRLRPDHFKGYGPINHKSVDLGLRYGYSMDCWGTLSLQYARRVYAYNFPKNTNLVLFEYYLPFGKQICFNY